MNKQYIMKIKSKASKNLYSSVPILLFLLFLNPFSVFSQPPKIFFLREELMANLTVAITERTVTNLQPYLHENFSFENHNGKNAVEALDMFLHTQKKLQGVVACSNMEKNGDYYENKIVLSVADYFNYGMARFTEDGLITYLNLTNYIESPKNKNIINNNPNILFHNIDLFFPGHIFVKGTYHGTGDLIFLDTGTPISGNKDSTFEVTLNNQKLILPGAELKPSSYQPILKMINLSYLESFGQNLFSSFTTTIDYVHKKLILAPLDTPIDTNEMDGYSSNIVDIIYGNQGHIFFRNCRIGKLFGLMQFDTGGWDIDLFFSQELADAAGYTYGKQFDINVDGFILNHAGYDTSSIFRDERQIHGNNVLGALYNGAFSNCMVTIYPKSNKILIRESKSIERGMNIGVNFTWSNSIVYNVIPGSVADIMGIKCGDKISAVNNQTFPIAYEMRMYLREWNPTMPLEIEVMRKNKKMKLHYNN